MRVRFLRLFELYWNHPDCRQFWMLPDCRMISVDDHISSIFDPDLEPTLFPKGGGPHAVYEDDAEEEYDITAMYDAMYRLGYVRVKVDQKEKVLYINGRPSNSQRRTLRDFAIEQGLTTAGG